MKAFKYRLYPTKGQCAKMQMILDCCRWVYNKGLEVRRDAWRERKEFLSRFDTSKMIPKWKTENEWLRAGHAQAMQESLARLDLAFRAFFRRVKAGESPGYPLFRGKDRYDSFAYPQEKGNWRFACDGRIRLSKVGYVKIKMHRPLEGRAKTLTVRRDALGSWWACFSCETKPKPLPLVPNVVGIDLGCEKFATLSTGEQIDNPRFFRQDEKALAKAQRHLGECEKSTPEYRKRKRAVQHIHQRIANRRADFAHKLSRRLVDEFQIIVFEDLDIQDMQNENWRSLNKSISDAAWGQLVRLTQEKAENAARTVIAVDPRNTSKMCSRCGQIVPKPLSERVHKCPYCNLEMNRDLNASLNILARGLACLGESPRSSPL